MLPVRRGAGWARQGTEPHPGEARELPRDADARPRRPNERLRLVEPDRHVGAQAADEAHRELRLPLRAGCLAGRREVAPCAGKVPVEVDASRVRAPLRGMPVGIQIGNDPERAVLRRSGVEQPRGDDAAGAFVSVNAADHEDARRSPAEPEGANRLTERARADLRRRDAVAGQAHMEVVVVVARQDLDDRRRSPKPRARPDETFAAPAATNRSTSSCASGRAI